MTTRYSKQREAILNYLVNTSEHPTAETIYEQIRHEIPNISLGTVYRNLSYLVETGHIMKIRTRNETMRFDARIREHYHLQCMVCGKVEDLAIHIDYKLDEEAERQSGAKIDHHELCFVGVCRECGDSTQIKNDPSNVVEGAEINVGSVENGFEDMEIGD